MDLIFKTGFILRGNTALFGWKGFPGWFLIFLWWGGWFENGHLSPKSVQVRPKNIIAQMVCFLWGTIALLISKIFRHRTHSVL